MRFRARRTAAGRCSRRGWRRRRTLRAQGGYSQVEMLATLLLVGIALVGSGGLLLQCKQLAWRIEDRAHAVHAAASEMDRLLATGAAGLPLGKSDWRSEADEECGLDEAKGWLEVEAYRGTSVRRVRVVLEWGGGQRVVRETLFGGGP